MCLIHNARGMSILQEVLSEIKGSVVGFNHLTLSVAVTQFAQANSVTAAEKVKYTCGKSILNRYWNISFNICAPHKKFILLVYDNHD